MLVYLAVIQHLGVSTERCRSTHHDDPAPDQDVPEHQLRRGHLHPGVQPDGQPTGWVLWVSLLSPTWTLSGYEVTAQVVEETHDAARHMPRAVIWSSWSFVFLDTFT